jgi:hypothetical protein
MGIHYNDLKNLPDEKLVEKLFETKDTERVAYSNIKALIQVRTAKHNRKLSWIIGIFTAISALSAIANVVIAICK